MVCPACQAENDDSAEVCFHCRAVLSAVTRGTVIAARYEVLTTLGRGGMGVVYQAMDRVLEETVAIKLLRSDVAKDTELARRFRSEIKLARKVTHRNVCRIHEYGEDGPLRFISMEFVEGTDLKKVLREKGPFPPEEAFEASIQSAQGLEAIHEVGIIHRDLKTTNIMRDGRGVVRLMDFGIAKLTGADGTTGATATGQIVGTPEYMSPEQARGLKAELRSDLYSLGIVVYELFTGRVPFKGETPVATLFMHVQDPPPLEGPAAQRLPQDLVSVLRRALAKDPADRYPGAREMCDALRQARIAWQQSGATVVPGRTTIVDSARPATPAPMATPPPSATLRGGVPSEAPTEVATRILKTTEKPRPSTRAPRATLPRPAHPPTSRAPWVALAAASIAIATVVAVLWLRSREASEPIVPLAAASVAPSTLASPPPASVALEPSRAPEAIASPAPTRANPPPRAASPTRTSAPERTPAPRPTRVLSPVAVAGASAGAATAAATPEPTPVPTPPPTTAAPAPPVTAPPTTMPASLPVEERGFLQVVVVPYAEATIDGTAMGRVSSSKVPLKAGSHTVVLSHPEYQPLQRKVTIVPGETVRLIIDLSEEAIRKKK